METSAFALRFNLSTIVQNPVIRGEYISVRCTLNFAVQSSHSFVFHSKLLYFANKKIFRLFYFILFFTLKAVTLFKRSITLQVRSLNFSKLLGGGVLHTKFWIIDRTHFYIGSANMDWRSLTQVKKF